MARKGQRTPARREATLETVEEHLKEQDRGTKKGRWVAFVALGFSVMVVGFSLLLDKNVGYILLVYGVAMMAWGAVQASRIK